MVLWTIVPPEDVLEGLDEDDRQVMTIHREGLTMEVEPLEGPTARLLRVLSSDPADYLDMRWQPGTLVPLTAGDLVM